MELQINALSNKHAEDLINALHNLFKWMKSRHETGRAMETFQVVHRDGSDWRQDNGHLGQSSKDRREE